MKKLLFLALVALVLAAGCTQQQQQPPINTTPTVSPPEQTQPSQEKTGTARFSFTDDAVQGYESIWVTIAGIEVHSNGDWKTVFEGSRTFDLVKLNGIKELVGEKELAAGKYTQVRLNVSKVELVENGETEAVKVPSEKIKLVKNFEIKENETTELVIDFDPYSIVVEAKQLILKPTIKILTVAEFDQKVEDAKKAKEANNDEKLKLKITQLSFPATAKSEGTVTISWRVSGGATGNREHTAVHWDTVGGHGENVNEYPNRTEIQTGKTPQDFSVQLKLPKVTGNASVFLRAHAIVDGTNVYSPEQQILVTAEQPPVQKVEEFTAHANDARFDPSSIEVTKGNMVKITFTVDTSNVSFGGLDIKSSEFETGTIAPGASKQVSFTATNSFTVTGYWPSSGVKKGDMRVTVK